MEHNKDLSLFNNLQINDITLNDLHIEKETDDIPSSGSISIELSSSKEEEAFIFIVKVSAENNENEKLFHIATSYKLHLDFDMDIFNNLSIEDQNEFFYKLVYPQLRSLISILTQEMGMIPIKLPNLQGK